MLARWLLGCQVAWITARSLQGSKSSPHQRLGDRSDTMTGRIMQFHWRQVTWAWLKLMPTRGRGKWRTGGRRNCMKWNTKLLKESLHTSWRTSGWDAHESSTRTDFFSSCPQRGLPFVCPCELCRPSAPPPTQKEQTPERSETEEAPQSINCLPPAQQQTAETPSMLGWTGSFVLSFGHFPEDPCWIKGEKFNAEGLGMWGSHHWCSDIRGTDHTGEASKIQPAMINSTPPLFVLEMASS